MLDSKDSFFYAILDGLYYSKLENKKKFGFCQISNPKFLQLDLSLSTFETQCYMINDMSKKFFLRLYVLRKRFHYLIKKVSKGKNTISKELLVCAKRRFSGF